MSIDRHGSARKALNESHIALKNYAAGEHRVTCPRCSHLRRKKHDKCLAVLIDEAGATWRCWNCDWTGGANQGAQICAPSRTASAGFSDTQLRDMESAARRWREAAPVKGTPAEIYLRGRSITCAPPVALRFHPNCWHSELERGIPAMLALMVDIKTNKPQGVHRTYLRADGSGKVQDIAAKKMLGPSGGACVKLTPDDEVTEGLAICEGLETGLSLLSMGWQAVWSALDAGGIERFPVLAGIECLTIFADADDKGSAAAIACARRWADAGQEARILSPKIDGADWNDVAQQMVAA